ncbi:unnamed protein product [Echinostoma caproni]|uniref:Type II toxin-antitoxin system HicA family toxin n=1 Tax=Echinostoma caproni TaxID=27848 RepID=A0A183A9P0_9TREM|nr:unnamed protein product [Echinostoma caproni]
MAYKRGLVKALFHRARSICSPDTLRDEEEFLKQTLLRNGYPERSIHFHGRQSQKGNASPTVPQKAVYIKPSFKSDQLLNDVRQI